MRRVDDPETGHSGRTEQGCGRAAAGRSRGAGGLAGPVRPDRYGRRARCRLRQAGQTCDGCDRRCAGGRLERGGDEDAGHRHPLSLHPRPAVVQGTACDLCAAAAGDGDPRPADLRRAGHCASAPLRAGLPSRRDVRRAGDRLCENPATRRRPRARPGKGRCRHPAGPWRYRRLRIAHAQRRQAGLRFPGAQDFGCQRVRMGSEARSALPAAGAAAPRRPGGPQGSSRPACPRPGN